MKKEENKNKYFSGIKSQTLKIACLVVFASMVFGAEPQSTLAYFSDEATISGNEFSAGTLILNLDSTATFSSDLLYNGDSQTMSSNISNGGSLDFNYEASTTLVGTDNAPCDYVEMTVSGPNSYSYSGSIEDFNSSTTAQMMATSSNADWNYTFKVKSGAPASVWGKTCFFKTTYTAWQTNLPDSSLGFYSVKEKSGEIKIGKAVVMNEILPNPEGLDTQHGLQGEWVELYNNSNISLDVSGWKIKDVANHEIIISSSNTMNGRTTIGAKGSYLEWVVVYMNDDIMNNDGDTISFYDDTGTLVDQYTYGNNATDTDSDSNSTGGADNNNPTGSETAGNEGKSYARIPDGTGGWVDPIPTPGEPNIYGEDNILLNEIITDTTGATTATSTENSTISGVISDDVEISTNAIATTTDNIASATEEITNASTTDNIIIAESAESDDETIDEVIEPIEQKEDDEIVTKPTDEVLPEQEPSDETPSAEPIVELEPEQSEQISESTE